MYLLTGNAENCQSEREMKRVLPTQGMEDTNKLLIVRT